MQGQQFNNMPPQGYPMQPPVQGIQSQGYNPNAYPYNAAAAAFNHYNSSDYACNQFTNPAAFGQGPQGGFKDKVKNFFRFGRPQPNVLLGPDGHPLPSAFIPKNEPGARRQKYVQDKAGVMDFLGQVEYQRANIVPHKNFHGGEFEATAGPLAGTYGPSPFPQNVGFGPNMAAQGPYLGSQRMPGPGPNMQSQHMAGPGFVGQPAGYGPGPQVMQGQGSMYQQQQGQVYQQPGSPLRRDMAPAPVGYNQVGSPTRRDMGPAPVGYNQGPAGGAMEKTQVEVKNLPNGGVEERKETFRREEYITKASKPSEDKTMSEKLQDKVGDAKEWVSDKLSGGPGETKESKKAEGMAKPEVVGKDLVDSEDKKTKEIINEGQKANH